MKQALQTELDAMMAAQKQAMEEARAKSAARQSQKLQNAATFKLKVVKVLKPAFEDFASELKKRGLIADIAAPGGNTDSPSLLFEMQTNLDRSVIGRPCLSVSWDEDEDLVQVSAKLKSEGRVASVALDDLTEEVAQRWLLDFVTVVFETKSGYAS